MIRMLGGMIGREARSAELVDRLSAHLDQVRASAARLAARPRVYFEEWDEPQISGIRWVSELIEIAGGCDCFAELSTESLAKNRIIADIAEVPRRQPDLILGSWCGKKFQPQKVRDRPGWQDIPAVRHGDLYEIKSSIILQPGPAALTDGVAAIHEIVRAWCERQTGAGARN